MSSIVCVKPVDNGNRIKYGLKYWGVPGRGFYTNYPSKEEQEAMDRRFREAAQRESDNLKDAIDDIRMDPVPEHICNSGPTQY